MIVDTSAIVAIAKKEDLAEALAAAMVDAPHLAISAPTTVELAAVLARTRDVQVSRRVERLMRAYEIQTVDFTAEHAELARRAYRDYGLGSGHPARLNLGDCFAYALAIHRDEPLLFVGDDFRATDVRTVELCE